MPVPWTRVQRPGIERWAADGGAVVLRRDGVVLAPGRRGAARAAVLRRDDLVAFLA
jgi:hypothetical protein